MLKWIKDWFKIVFEYRSHDDEECDFVSQMTKSKNIIVSERGSIMCTLDEEDLKEIEAEAAKMADIFIDQNTTIFNNVDMDRLINPNNENVKE